MHVIGRGSTKDPTSPVLQVSPVTSFLRHFKLLLLFSSICVFWFLYRGTYALYNSPSPLSMPSRGLFRFVYLPTTSLVSHRSTNAVVS